MKRFSQLNSLAVISFALMLFSCPAHAAHTVGLSWNAPAAQTGIAVTGYKVYRGTAAGGEGASAYATVTGNVTNYTDATVTAGTSYFYKITATGTCDATVYDCSAFVNESAPSNEATTGPIPLPAAPAIGAPSAAVAVVH